MENINPNGETNLLLKGAQYLFAGLLLGVFGGILCIVYWLIGEDGESIARLTAIFVGIVELYAFRLMECGDDKTDYFNKAGKAQLFCLILMILSFLMNFLFVRNLNMPYKAINLAVSIACIVITIIVAQYLGKGLSISCRDRDNKLADLFDVYRIIMLAFGFQYIVLLIIASISSFKLLKFIGFFASLGPIVIFFIFLQIYIRGIKKDGRSERIIVKSSIIIGVMGVITLILIVGLMLTVKLGLIQSSNNKILDYYEKNDSDTVGQVALFPGIKPGATDSKYYKTVSTYAELNDSSPEHCIVELPIENIEKLDGSIPYVYIIGVDSEKLFHVYNQSLIFDGMRYDVGMYVLTFEDGVKVGAGIPNLIYEKLISEAENGRVTLPLGRIYHDLSMLEDFYYCDFSDVYAHGGSSEMFLNYYLGINRGIVDALIERNEKLFIFYSDIIALIALGGYWLFMKNKCRIEYQQ